MARGRPKNVSSRTRSNMKRKIDPAVSVWEHLRRLLARELYEDAILLFEVTNLCNDGTNLKIPRRLADIATYTDVARAYYETQRYAPSEKLYKNVLDFLPFPERSSEDDNDLDFSVDGVRYQYYECLFKMKKYIDAYAVLTEIKDGESQDKIIQAMHEVVKLSQIKRPGIEKRKLPWNPTRFDDKGYQECESSIGSVAYILRNGLKSSENFTNLPMAFVNSFVGPEKHDIEMWLKAQEMISEYKFQKAVDFLKRMSHFNSRIQCEMAKLMYQIGRKEETRRLLQSAFDVDNCWIEGLDLLAFLSSRDEAKYGAQLERLSAKLLQLWPDRPETHVVTGYMSKYIDSHLAMQFASRAIYSSIPGTEQYAYACLLKSSCYRDNIQQMEAMELLREALEHDNRNTELNLALVDLLLENDEYREAKNLVNNLVYNNPRDVHAKLLKVHVYINVNNRNRDMTNSAVSDLIRVLDDVLTCHPHVIGSVTTLLNECYKTEQFDKCTIILEGIEKYKHYLTHSKKAIYHRLHADYNMKFIKPVQAYSHMVAAMGLGSEVSTGYMADMEYELRTTGRTELDQRLPLLHPNDSMSDSSTVAGSPSPSTSSLRCRPCEPSTSRAYSGSPQPSTSREPPPFDYSPPSPSTSQSTAFIPTPFEMYSTTFVAPIDPNPIVRPTETQQVQIIVGGAEASGETTPPDQQDENIAIDIEYSDGSDEDEDEDDEDTSSSSSSDEDIQGRMGFGRGY